MKTENTINQESLKTLSEEISKQLPGAVRVFLFALIIMYEEAVLHLSTLGGYEGLSVVMTFLFSIAFGLLMHGVRMLVTNQKVRRIVTLILMTLTAFVFMVFYFMYMQFKMFYGLDTIFFAGGDAAEGFTGEIVRMVTSAEGIVHIILFLLPSVLYFVCTRRLLQKEKNLYPVYSRRKKATCFIATAFVFAFGIAVTRINPGLNTAYAKNYNFSNAVSRFGLLTGIRRDAVRMITGEDKQVSFTVSAAEVNQNNETEGADAQQTEISGDDASAAMSADASAAMSTDASGDVQEKPVVYGDNVLDIDFAKMAEESTGTYAAIDAYVSTLKPTKQNEYTGLFKGKNLIFITMESFSGFPIDEELFPTLYKMQHEGFYFPNYTIPYVAVTTGSEYSLLKGILPMAGAASMVNTSSYHNYMTLGSFLTREGYYGQMFHNGDVWYYDRNITHNKLGYTEPYMAYYGGLDELIEKPYPRRDEDMVRVTLPFYAKKEPFNIYYITMSGHSPYEISNNPFAVAADNEAETSETQSSASVSDATSDSPSSASASVSASETPETESAACEMEAYAKAQQTALKKRNYTPIVETYLIYQMEVDKMTKVLLDGLEQAGVLEDTVIVMTGDHYPYGVYDGTGYRKLLGELYGYEIVNDFDRDRNNLIIWTPSLADAEPVTSQEPVSALDVLPTLLNLFGLPYDSRLLPGRDVFSDADALVFNASYDWRTSLGTYIAATGVFTPATGVKETEIPDGYVERTSETVKNKIEYSRSLTYNDYYYHVFGEEYAFQKQNKNEKQNEKQKENRNCEQIN